MSPELTGKKLPPMEAKMNTLDGSISSVLSSLYKSQENKQELNFRLPWRKTRSAISLIFLLIRLFCSRCDVEPAYSKAI